MGQAISTLRDHVLHVSNPPSESSNNRPDPKPEQKSGQLALLKEPPFPICKRAIDSKLRRQHKARKYRTSYQPEEISSPLTRLPPELVRHILNQIYINICEEECQTFGCARFACDEFSDSAPQEYGPYVGAIWSEPYRTVAGATRAMTRLMDRAPKDPAWDETWDWDPRDWDQGGYGRYP